MNKMGKISLKSLLTQWEDKLLCAPGGRCASTRQVASGQAGQPGARPSSPATARGFCLPWSLQPPSANRPQHRGWRTGEEQHRLEGLPQVGGPQNCGRWKLGLMESVYVWSSKAALSPAHGTQRGFCPRLCILTARARGPADSTVGEDLST